MSRHILADRVYICDYWLAVTMIYAGVDCVSITLKNGKAPEFCLICPKFDYDSYYSEWHSAEGLSITNGKAFAKVASEVGRIVRDVKRDGEWVNPDFSSLLREYKADQKRGTLPSDESD
jgi:hypothetical protein